MQSKNPKIGPEVDNLRYTILSNLLAFTASNSLFRKQYIYAQAYKHTYIHLFLLL